MGRRDFVADNSLLSNFARGGYMDLLRGLFPDVLWTTRRVIDEIERGVGRYPDLQVLLDVAGSWLRGVEDWDLSVESHFRQRYAAVRRGADASVLAVAKEGRRAWTVLTDDKGMIRVC